MGSLPWDSYYGMIAVDQSFWVDHCGLVIRGSFSFKNGKICGPSYNYAVVALMNSDFAPSDQKVSEKSSIRLVDG